MSAPQIASHFSPDYLACPKCHAHLNYSGSGAVCTRCNATYGFRDHVLNLLEGEPFHDESDPARVVAEERKDTHTTNQFILPLLAKARARKQGGSFRVLSVGCGVGKDVDLINAAGYECVGIDCGSRVEAWRNRTHPDHLYMASATSLPFAGESFDFVFSGCVLAHIGVVGDTWQTTPNYWEERSRFCAEVTRVTKRGGQIVLSGANRNFPFDLFHRDRGYLPRFHLPAEKFLISFSDYKKLFVQQCGCSRVNSVAVEGYWGFNGLRKFLVGRICEKLITAHLKLVSSGSIPYLQRSFLNPWLIVSVEK